MPGKTLQGVDRIFEATGDFITAILRIMPHASDQERFNRIIEEMKQVKVTTLSELRGEPAKPIDDIEFPPVGQDKLPPTEVFWSLTLYDLENGFFIPNDRKKYSVGENAGMHGYRLGKKNTTQFEVEALSAITDNFIDHCLGNPNDKALAAFDKIAN